MKKLLYALLAIQTVSTALATDRTWNGSSSTDWATAANWSPNGLPTAQDILTINSATNAPVITGGTAAEAGRIVMTTGATLTISEDASLTITNTLPGDIFPTGINMGQAVLINYGTLTVNRSSSWLSSVGIGGGESSITNSGTINLEAWTYAIQLSGITSLTNTVSGVISAKGNTGIKSINGGRTTISNLGVMNLSGESGGYGFSMDHGDLSNSGTINLVAGEGFYINSSSTIQNEACGKIIFNNDMAFANSGIVSNSGSFEIDRRLENYGTITNSGVFKYGTLVAATGTITNSGIILKDKTEPIVTVGVGNSLSIAGIYRNSAGTVSAGTFTEPDQFSPSGLPPGDNTLYAKITPAGNGCEYLVPFIYTSSALPVTLVQFSGKSTASNQNTLTWLTSEERNFNYFEIQRSSDGHSFEAIGRISASDHSSALRSYQFVDNQTSGMIYYRLKMIDQDGSHQFSKIISVLNSFEKNIVGDFYPNPSGGPVFIDVYTKASENWQIRLFDINGKLIRAESRTLQKGMNQLDFTNLVNGVNIVQFENGQSIVSRKVLGL